RLSGADGALDPAFGGGGTGQRLFAPPAGYTLLSGNDVTLDGGGNIVTVGSALAGGAFDMAVVRLTADGSAIDPGFNGGAVKILDTGVDEFANGVVIGPGGTIVLAGQASDPGVSQ